jgi:hypothetical protein
MDSLPQEIADTPLGLATMDQICWALISREIPYVFLIPPNPRVERGDKGLQIHTPIHPGIAEMACRDAMEVFQSANEGNDLPEGCTLYSVGLDENGNRTEELIAEVPYEEEDDPWDDEE